MGLVTPDFGLVFWMILSFSVVIYVLGKFAWKPILQSLKNRENSIQEALDAADRTKKEMAQLQADNEKIMAEARQERDNLLKEARETKDKLINEAKVQAAVEANKMMINLILFRLPGR
jgi:F-type H+-transporting ATPase subunit b